MPFPFPPIHKQRVRSRSALVQEDSACSFEKEVPRSAESRRRVDLLHERGTKTIGRSQRAQRNVWMSCNKVVVADPLTEKHLCSPSHEVERSLQVYRSDVLGGRDGMSRVQI